MKSNKIDVCKVKLDSGRLVFYPGEKLTGTFRLEMNRSMDMDSIFIKCKGKIKAEWEEKYQDEEGNPKEREYESKHKIFENKQTVFGKDKGKDKHPAGEHDYPFSFDLPQNIPSSFEGSDGFIRYQLIVVVKKSWKKDLKLKKMFVVNDLIDVNKDKYNAAPGDEDQKTLGCLCCASGPLTLNAHLNRTGYCGGESILVTATVGNNTSREMDDLKATLMQEIIYNAKLKGVGSFDTKKVEKEIAELKSKDINPGDTLTWENKEMALPPMIPSIKTEHITVKYYVQVHLDVPMGIDMDFKLPVVIGTVPYIPPYEVDKENKFTAKAPEKIGPAPMAFLGQPSMKPFQYSQDLKQKHKKMNKDEKVYQENEYLPVYTFAVPSKENYRSRSSSPKTDEGDNMPPIQ